MITNRYSFLVLHTARSRSLVLLWLACLAAGGCTGSKPESTPKAQSGSEAYAEHSSAAAVARRAQAGYAGSAACAECHSEQAQHYHSQTMARSLLPPEQATPIEDFEHPRFSPAPSLEYYVEKTAEGVVHHERKLNSAGEVIYDQGMPVAFTVGSGSRGRSYLIDLDGRMFVSPISWYSGPHKWDWSPGYAVDNNFRFERKASEGCLSCHTGLVAPHPEDHDRFARPPVIEASIGCERCHGPGSAHIAYQSGRAPAGATDSIVNPEKLPGAKRDAVCNQCHLAGKRRVVRLGRSEFDFQPGMYLSDNWVIFLKTEGIETGVAGAVSQAEQMFASQCYLKSNGELGCITCHDSHSATRGESPAQIYRQKCLKCHGGKAPECSEPLARRQELPVADSCMECHMGKFPAADVHAAQTNHRIARQKPVVPANVAVGPRRPRSFDDGPVLFVEPGAPFDEGEWDRARGIYFGERTGSVEKAKAAIALLEHLEKDQNCADVEGLYFLGQAAESVNQPNRAARLWERILKLDPRHERALESLAIHYHEARNLGLAQQYYERLIVVNPAKSQYYGRLAHVLGQAGDLQAAIPMAEKCLELNPSLPQTHAWLVDAYRGIGDEERAKYHEAKLRDFQSVQPTPRKAASGGSG
ncbi:MAG: hypothetical protein JSS02_16975 [Planctomycetes bacterium]|nr:hypothetical protein [Planctomycetota bacterium]